MFIPKTESIPQTPTALIMDFHTSRDDAEFQQLCKQHGVQLILLPGGCTDEVQPLDQLFGNIKSEYANLRDENYMGKRRLNDALILELFCQAMQKHLTPLHIQAAWRATGLYPLNEDLIRSFPLVRGGGARGSWEP